MVEGVGVRKKDVPGMKIDENWRRKRVNPGEKGKNLVKVQGEIRVNLEEEEKDCAGVLG